MAGTKKKTSAENEVFCTCQMSSECIKKKGKNTKGNFYMSNSDLYKGIGLLPICKDCLKVLFEKYSNKYNDEKLALYKMCEKLDLPYHESAYVGAKNKAEKVGWLLHQAYFTQINSFKDNNGYGNDFEGGESLLKVDISNNDEDMDKIIDNEIKNFEVTKDIISFFGRGFSKENYYYLVDEYNDWINRYECDSKAMEDIIKQICLTSLDIHNRRIKGEKVDQQLKTLQDLLGSANLKPVQETGANATEQATFGTLLKKWENEKPVPEPLKSWEKSNWIKKYVMVWFLGHLSKMLGLKNSNSELYEEEIKKYSIELPSEENAEDGE